MNLPFWPFRQVFLFKWRNTSKKLSDIVRGEGGRGGERVVLSFPFVYEKRQKVQFLLPRGSDRSEGERLEKVQQVGQKATLGVGHGRKSVANVAAEGRVMSRDSGKRRSIPEMRDLKPYNINKITRRSCLGEALRKLTFIPRMILISYQGR